MNQGFHDNHNHTEHFSPDARQTLSQLVSDAMQKGLAGLTLTEHYDKDIIDGLPRKGITPYGAEGAEGEWVFDFAAYDDFLVSKQQAIAASGSSFQLLKGIEVGYVPYQNPDIWNFLAQHRFDSIILSVHCIDEVDVYSNSDEFGADQQGSTRKYLELIHGMLKDGLDFDIVGHYDYITRYMPGPYKALIYTEYADLLDEIFRLLAAQGKALELNTRTRYRRRDKDGSDPGLPDENLYRRYRELGGEFVALSSDSHEAGGVGSCFGESAAFLQRCGFRYLAHFRNRKPIAVRID